MPSSRPRAPCRAPDPPGHSCSTFHVAHGDDLLVGHNLDEYIPVPGLVIANPRGMAKVSTSWAELTGEVPPLTVPHGRLGWRSRYASLVYSTRGREAIDGGLNEAGLYVGEMTLMGTRYPEVPGAPRMYQVLWLQYLLDCFADVGEVVDHLADVQLDGTCQWHFYVADRQGRAAAIEFTDGATRVHTGTGLPVPLLCNAAYADELARLERYAGIGDADLVETPADPDLRFLRGARLLARGVPPGRSPLDWTWEVVLRLRGESPRWSLVCDLHRLRLHFCTDQGPGRRHIDLRRLDLSPGSPVLAADINDNGVGDMSTRLVPLTYDTNREYLTRFWTGVDFGELASLKPRLIEHSALFVEAMDARAAGWVS